MMNNVKIITILTLIFTLLFSNYNYSNNTNNNWPYYDGELSSKSAFVMDLNSSIILYENNCHEKLYPASLVKIMTAIIVIEKSNGNYEDIVNFSYNSVTRDIDKNSVTIGASAGDQLSVKDCLYSLLLPSANDAANALAEHIAGSINDFALLMNEKAKNLGLENTNFVNPSGLHDDNQYSTAYDMAIILKEAMKHEIFMQISSSISYRHAPIRRYRDPDNSNNLVLNTNSIMVPGSGYYYDGITSGKTGHTSLAGYNLASSAKRDNMHLICVVLGARNEKLRFNDTKNLYDFYFDNYQSLTIKEVDDRFNKDISSISINDINLVSTLNITCNDDAHITFPKSYKYEDVDSILKYEIKDQYNKYAIGYIDYFLEDTFIGSCTIEGKTPIEPPQIYTSHLNLSKNLDEDTNELKNNLNENNNHANNNYSLFYKSSNNKIILSDTLMTSIIIIITFIIIFSFMYFIYTKIISNTNFPLHKITFRIKRMFKKK